MAWVMGVARETNFEKAFPVARGDMIEMFGFQTPFKVAWAIESCTCCWMVRLWLLAVLGVGDLDDPLCDVSSATRNGDIFVSDSNPLDFFVRLSWRELVIAETSDRLENRDTLSRSESVNTDDRSSPTWLRSSWWQLSENRLHKWWQVYPHSEEHKREGQMRC